MSDNQRMNISEEAVEAAAKVICESHHWVSTSVPGLHIRWVIQCSLCGAYNVEEMNATLEAAAPHLMAEAWEDGYAIGVREERSGWTGNPYRSEGAGE